MTLCGVVDPESFNAALSSFHDMQEARLRAMYNRQRAIFAEFLVAAFLPNATVELDPSAAWDVSWPTSEGRTRIQVKCSGRVLPHHPASTSPASWEITVPRTAWDPETMGNITIDDHQCDVFVLARHTGDTIEDGWTFRVARPLQLRSGRRTAKQLDALGIGEVDGSSLAVAIHLCLAAR